MKKICKHLIAALLTSAVLCGGQVDAAMDTTSLQKPQNSLYYIHNAKVNFNTKEQKDRAHKLIFSGEDYPLAISILNKVISVDPDDSEAYILRAMAYSETKEYYKAEDDYKSALMLEPENPTFYYMRGVNYLRMNYQYGKAREMFKKALAIEPNYINAMVGIGHSYYNGKQYKEAIEWYNKVLVLYPNHGTILADKQDAQENLKAIEEEQRKRELAARIG